MASPKVEQNRAIKAEAIKAEARLLLARDGASSLSLRAVARSMGLASSALYRYFESRDALLTSLIVDAYDDLGEACERSVQASAAWVPRARFAALCGAIRNWALAQPHAYGLLFGTPIPGYAAPATTIDAATRVPLAFAAILHDAPLESANDDAVPAGTLVDAALVAILPGQSRATHARALCTWSSVFGLVSFELFGHFVGSVADPERFFDVAVANLADLIGVPR
jgi:AcrR family transcriptional regulator